MSKRLTQEEVERYYLDRGYRLLSRYVNAHEKNRVINTETGLVFYQSYHDFSKGKRPYSDHKAKPYLSKKQFYLRFKMIFGDEYTLLSPYKGMKTKVIARHNKCGSMCSKTAGSWLYAKNGCKLCSHGSSNGERVVYNLLLTSHVDFEYSKRMRVNNHLREFDFYLPTYNTYIEYDGEQHKINRNSWYRGTDIDKQKDLYIKSTGASLIRIPYTIKSPKDVYLFLTQRGININYTTDTNYLEGIIDKVSISKYYETHTIEETEKKYAVSMQTIIRSFHLVNGDHVNKKHKTLALKKEIATFYLHHSTDKTLEAYPYDISMIRKYVKQVYGVTKTEYLKQHPNLRT